MARDAVRASLELVALFALLDALTTIVGIQRGVFRELNPVLEMALAVHVGWFLLLKGGCTLLFGAVMYRVRERRWVPALSAGVAGAYALIVLRSAWHLAA